jgi:hypothetical protein
METRNPEVLVRNKILMLKAQEEATGIDISKDLDILLKELILVQKQRKQ